MHTHGRRIQRSIHILVFAFDVYIGLINPIALVRRLQMRSAAFVQVGCIGLHPAPNTAGIHLDTTFGHQLGDVLVGERIPGYQRTHKTITSPENWRPLNGLWGLIGMEFYPTKMPGSQVRNRTLTSNAGARQIQLNGRLTF
jgi:hypothetical protein